MFRKLTFLAAGCTAAAGLVALLAIGPRSDGATVSPARPVPQDPRELVLPEAPKPQGRVALVPAHAREHASLEAAGAPVLGGRLIAYDGPGHPRFDAAGSFRLRVRGPTAWRVETVDVLDGRWTASGPPGRDHDVLELMVEGRPAALVDRGGLVVGEGELVVHARVSPPASLRVVDIRTGVDLDQVELAIGAPSSAGRASSAPRTLARALASPLDLEALTETQRRQPRPSVYWARAPGFAWSSITIDHAQGGERVLALAPASGLTVVVHGPLVEGSVLRLRSATSTGPAVLVLEQPPSVEGPTVLVGVAPGAYELTLETRDRPARVLGSAEVDLAGEELLVVLEVQPPAAGGRVALFGSVRASQAWAGLEPVLEVRSERGPWVLASLPLGELPWGPGGARLWSAGSFPPGFYEVRIAACGYRETLELSVGSRTPHELVIPDPADVAVWPVHPDGVTPWEGIQLNWAHAALPGCRGTAEVDPTEPGRHTFRAPSGLVTVRALDRTGRTLACEVELVVRPGPNRRVLPLVAPCVIELRLVEGGTRVPWDELLHAVEVRSLLTGERVETVPPVCQVPESGEYELRFEHLRGYEPLSPRRVWVGDGESVALQVALTRSP